IYAADGEAAGGLAQRIEPLILSGELPPLLIVGAHAGELACYTIPACTLQRADRDYLVPRRGRS
ncbi:MAG: hypothetical protein HGA45_24410, partial [Chloroflexales bacterium]|nr:hypothetical protein [Chloroflexales bacterium]